MQKKKTLERKKMFLFQLALYLITWKTQRNKSHTPNVKHYFRHIETKKYKIHERTYQIIERRAYTQREINTYTISSSHT